MEDSALVQLLRFSPEDGLRQAITLYGGYAKAVALRILGQNRLQDVEEVLGDVYCSVWRNIDKYVPEKGSFKGWICTIARNLSIDCLRQTQLSAELPEALEFAPDFADAVAAKMNRYVVRETVDSLPEPEKTIFFRRYFFKSSVGEIAQELDMDYKAVENRLYRGKQKLRRELEERGVIL